MIISAALKYSFATWGSSQAALYRQVSPIKYPSASVTSLSDTMFSENKVVNFDTRKFDPDINYLFIKDLLPIHALCNHDFLNILHRKRPLSIPKAITNSINLDSTPETIILINTLFILQFLTWVYFFFLIHSFNKFPTSSYLAACRRSLHELLRYFHQHRSTMFLVTRLFKELKLTIAVCISGKNSVKTHQSEYNQNSRVQHFFVVVLIQAKLTKLSFFLKNLKKNSMRYFKPNCPSYEYIVHI